MYYSAISLPEQVGDDHGGDHLDDLVADAGSAAHGEGQKVGGALEGALRREEPLRQVLQRPVPQLRGVVTVVVVDEHHRVGSDVKAWTKCYSLGNESQPGEG